MKLAVAIISLGLSLPLIGCTLAESQPVFPVVQGNWRSTNQEIGLFTELHFSGKETIFTSRGDTVYRFKYELSVSPAITTLRLTDIYGKSIISRLLKADNDSLVFASLWEVPRIQRFYKIRKK